MYYKLYIERKYGWGSLNVSYFSHVGGRTDQPTILLSCWTIYIYTCRLQCKYLGWHKCFVRLVSFLMGKESTTN